MKSFNYFQPTEIRFGMGRTEEVGEVVAKLGKRCLLVSSSKSKGHKLTPVYERIKRILTQRGVLVEHFDGVIPNPTTEVVSSGARIAESFDVDVVLGVGGGSSMDAAKAIAVEAVHPGTSWDYLYCKNTQPTPKTLPVVVVSTTSGTGSQVTQVAVVSNPEVREKSAIFNPMIYPKTCIIDPELMVTMPEHLTASTGFDVFCHAFESYIHKNASPYTDLLALEAIRLVAKYLPLAVEDGLNREARVRMAWADTLAGLCIANAGVTLPHGIGMAIGGLYPQVMHGEALAAVYPEFARYTFPYAEEKFAVMGQILNPALIEETRKDAARESCGELESFLKKIGLWMSLEALDIPKEEIEILTKASMVLPDYENNPRIATREEINEILLKCYSR